MLILNVYCPELIQSLDYSSVNIIPIQDKETKCKGRCVLPFQARFFLLFIVFLLNNILFYIRRLGLVKKRMCSSCAQVWDASWTEELREFEI